MYRFWYQFWIDVDVKIDGKIDKKTIRKHVGKGLQKLIDFERTWGGFGEPFGSFWERKNDYFGKTFRRYAQDGILEAKSIDLERIWGGF